MALTIGTVNLPTRNHVIGNRREVVCDVTLDNSYPVGGYSLPFTRLGIDVAPDVVTAASSDGHTYAYDYAAQKLKVFSGGTEVADTTDLHTVVVRLVARGKGFGTSPA